MQKKSNSLLFLLGSLGLVVVGIIFTYILNATRSPEPTTTDVRARATAVSTLEMLGTIQSVDMARGVVLVSNVAFASEPEKNLGSWTVTLPADVKTLTPGRQTSFTIDPETFSVDSKTVRATKID